MKGLGALAVDGMYVHRLQSGWITMRKRPSVGLSLPTKLNNCIPDHYKACTPKAPLEKYMALT